MDRLVCWYQSIRAQRAPQALMALMASPGLPSACPELRTPFQPQGCQLQAQRGCSRAGLQLPTASPCLAMGPADPGPPSGPRLIPKEVPIRRDGAAPGCPAPGWGSGTGHGCQALPRCHKEPPQLLAPRKPLALTQRISLRT